jgi:hypothetical protein
MNFEFPDAPKVAKDANEIFQMTTDRKLDCFCALKFWFK